jgi:hypothetical protein
MAGRTGVWRTVNAGKRWDFCPGSLGQGIFSDIFFADTLVGYITNESGTYGSGDGGKTWARISQERGEAIFFTSKNFGWGTWVSIGGFRAKNLAYTADSGKTWNEVLLTSVEQTSESHDSPVDFTVHGNYPNPFNPETKISFQVYRPNAHIKLIVYDVNGKEVITLMDRTMSAGNYQILWNGKNAHDNSMPSGVYFYDLSSERFRQTKKMLLLQ